MTTLAEQLRSLREARGRAARALGGLSEAQLGQAAEWRGRPTEVRHLLLLLAERDGDCRVSLSPICAALGWQQTEAQRILALAAETRGHLRAILVGLPDDRLDVVPAPGEWTIRQVLAHHLAVERRYMLQTAYAAERIHGSESLPARLPDDRLPPVAGEPVPGESLDRILARLEELRAEVVARLAGLTPEELVAPATWAQWSIDVRFRLHRLATHERQHAVQISKALTAIGYRQTEAQMILGEAEISLGALEAALVGLPDDLASRAPGAGLPSVVEVLARALAEEGETVEVVRRGVS